MTLKEKLEFCTICTKRELNFKTGLVCSITNEKPNFENNCENFDKDADEARKKLDLELNAAGNSQAQHGSTKPGRNKLYGVLVLIFGLVIILVSLVIGTIIIVSGISFIIKGYQQDKVLENNKSFNEKLKQ